MDRLRAEVTKLLKNPATRQNVRRLDKELKRKLRTHRAQLREQLADELESTPAGKLPSVLHALNKSNGTDETVTRLSPEMFTQHMQSLQPDGAQSQSCSIRWRILSRYSKRAHHVCAL